MEPVTIALGLAKVTPSIIGLFKGDGAKDKATQVLEYRQAGDRGVGRPGGGGRN